MLRSLVTSGSDKDKNKEERKLAKSFFRTLDARMDTKKTGADEAGVHRSADNADKPGITSKVALLAPGDEYCPTRKAAPTPKTADELLAERRRAMAEHEREMERKRQENLLRLKIENEKKRGQGGNRDRTDSDLEREDAMLGKRKHPVSLKSLHDSAGYNPLAPKPQASQKVKTPASVLPSNDPSLDPRFQFSLKVSDEKPPQVARATAKPSYNPLQSAKAVGI